MAENPLQNFICHFVFTKKARKHLSLLAFCTSKPICLNKDKQQPHMIYQIGFEIEVCLVIVEGKDIIKPLEQAITFFESSIEYTWAPTNNMVGAFAFILRRRV